MQMDKSEILTSYKLAKEKGKQLQILAELNGCNKLEIVKILVEGGFDRRSFNRVLSQKEREAMEAEEKMTEETAVQAEPDPEETTVQEPQSEEYYELCSRTNKTIDELIEKNQNLVKLNDELIEENRRLRSNYSEINKELKELRDTVTERCSQCTESAISELTVTQMKTEKLQIKLKAAEERIQKLEKAIVKMVVE